MKSMLKKHIAMLLCLCLCLSLFPAAYAEDYEQVLTETDEALPEINNQQTDEEIVQAYPEDETLYEELLNETELPDEMTDTVLETPEEEDLSARLETVFAGISIPEIEQNEIPVSTVRRSNVSAAATLFTAENYGDGLCPVLFYTEKCYDLIGLVVADSEGKVLEPAATDGGWTYLLAPGAYTYRYHDDRAIFADLEETGFTVDGALEIPLALTAAFEDNFTFSWDVNPLYENLVDEAAFSLTEYTYEDALDEMIEYKIAESENIGRRRMLHTVQSPEVQSPEVQLRKAMSARQERTSITFQSSEMWNSDIVNATYAQVLKAAVQHTGNHWEGDTLSFGYYQYGKSAEWALEPDENGIYTNTIIFVFVYHTTAAQEEAVFNAVDDMAAGLAGTSEYQKAYAIHEWLYQNVNYDWVHYGDTSYHQQFTDYGALIKRIAVCQGFSIAFYRIALAAGLDARVVTSTAMGHAWNVVEIDGIWYELDATWDSNGREKETRPLSQLPYYFLRGSTWWLSNHKYGSISVLGDQFDSSTGHYDPSFDAYMLSTTDYAPQEPGTYIVSYNANGGDSAPGSQVKFHGTDLTLTTERPTRADAPETRYYLTLDANGGTIPTSSNPAAPSKRYYRDFSGKYSLMRWNTKSNGTGTNYAPGGIYSENASMELFAIWGRTYPHVSLKTLSVPTREGYRFKGWGRTSTATEIVNDDYAMITTESTLYAVWEVKTYAVSYDANGGENAPAAQTKTHDVPLPITSSQPTRAATSETLTVSFDANGGGTNPAPISAVKTKAFTFKNWNTKADGSGTEYASNAAYIANEDATLYAQWNEIVMTSPETIQLPTLTREGYSFKGWGMSSTASEVVADPYRVSENTTLYAVWEIEQYTVSFETDGGSEVASQTVAYGEHAVKPADPTKAASWFVGWYTETAPENEFDFTNTAIKGDTTLYAVWVQPDFVLPDALTDIEAEAFAGCAFTFVKLAENTETVGPRAFADCPNLKYIYIPAGATVDDTAFQNVEGLTVFRPAA